MDDRQRLEAIVSVINKYLPPDGIPINDAMSEIISLVDPLPAPQPAQEPVAYLTKRKIGGTEGLLRADMVDRSAKNQETHDFIPLYTTSPQPAQEPHEYDWSMLEAAKESLREHMARIKELEAALAQPAQEPVVWWNGNSKFAAPKWKDWDKRTGGITAFGCDIPLYTAPPQREWVGLTAEERQDIALEVPMDAVFITEAKLKEKNNGT